GAPIGAGRTTLRFDCLSEEVHEPLSDEDRYGRVLGQSPAMRRIFGVLPRVAASAPAGAVAYSLILGARYAGKALALSVVLALLPCLSVAIALGQMARHLPSAGALFTFPARALHPWLG